MNALNDYLFMGAYEWNKIHIYMNEMRVNDSEMSMRWNSEAWPITGYIIPSRIKTKEEKNSETYGFYAFLEKETMKDKKQVSLKLVK